jgi:hypothetical protein
VKLEGRNKSARSSPIAVSTALLLASALGLGAPLAHAQDEALLKKGETVPEFVAEGVDGARHEIRFAPGSATVLLFFLSSCPTCHKMIPEWNRAFGRRPETLRVVGVLLDREPPGFFQLVPVAFPVVRAPSRAFLDQIKVRRVPMTVRVGPGGKVEEAEVGIVDPIRLGEIFRP